MPASIPPRSGPLAPDHLCRRHLWIVAVCCMEQIIGAGLSTLVGIIIPMINLTLHPELSPLMQGIAAAASLLGIAVSSPVIGHLADRHGYLAYFRACPVIILVGGLVILLSDNVWANVVGLFIAGIGVGGGYSLDSAYISELIPPKWRNFMVGVSKASSAIGFIGIALVSYIIIDHFDNADVWPHLAIPIIILAAITLLMRIRWAQSPQWYINKGDVEGARKAATLFFGKQNAARFTYTKAHATASPTTPKTGFSSLLKRENISKVIFSGIPWACEGLGVYGVGVFLPALVMSLGIETAHLHGLEMVKQSVIITTVINCFILLGFIYGLYLLRRVNHLR